MGILKNVNALSEPTHLLIYLPKDGLLIYLPKDLSFGVTFQNTSTIVLAIFLAPGVSKVMATLFST